MIKHDNNTSQRLMPFRTAIPFYILFDLDLNANHIRFYGQIEQMESNPNPNVNPKFSYSWIAKELCIDRSNAIRTANILKNKGYIEHVQIDKDNWVWKTVKNKIIDTPSGAQCDPPSRTECDPPSRTECDPNIYKYKSNNLNNIDPSLSTSKKSEKLSLSDLENENPHNISSDMIKDWISIRKTKKATITNTAWKRINSTLKKLQDAGINPQDAFERMVASGWQGIEFSYFDQQIAEVNKKKSKISGYNDESTEWIHEIKEEDLF